MSRVEENKKMVEYFNHYTDNMRKTETIIKVLLDISKSLAVIADNMKREDEKK